MFSKEEELIPTLWLANFVRSYG